MKLKSSQVRFLRRRAHHLKPVVQLGQQGLTEAVLAAIEEALTDHELIKVRLPALPREEKRHLCLEIRERSGAVEVQRIGHILVLYRPHPERPRLELPV